MDASKPVVFQFSLGDRWMQEMVDPGNMQEPSFRETIIKLREVAIVQSAWSADEAVKLLGQNQTPHAILITDPGIVKPKNEKLSRQVIEYARNGGTVVLTLCFSSNIAPDKFSSYMKEWDLPWKFHSYTRESCVVNTSAVGPRGVQRVHGLPATYESKSVFITNVAHEASWYLPEPYDPDDYESEESFKALPPRKETPFAFSKVGNGYLGFTGDVNQHETTDTAVMTMLGLNNLL
ncbi:hypothetical protein F4781DRAFT_333886 [Annulohypoxylon bovei var. microspora]|nr:hypothetical protein F4781DRAFT_333886 [Annulohypoxylon bovei var. microspora]